MNFVSITDTGPYDAVLSIWRGHRPVYISVMISLVWRRVPATTRHVARCLSLTSARCLSLTSARCLSLTSARCLSLTSARCLSLTSARCLSLTFARCLSLTSARCLSLTSARCLSLTSAQRQEPSTDITAETNQTTLFSREHAEMRTTLRKIIEKDINPYVDEWEEQKSFPAHQVFKVLGDAGLLGVSRETEYGGLGLDYSYNVALAEELGSINCGGVPMAVAVHTDMSTPALARFGSDQLKREFLAPSISGDFVSCLGVSEPGAGSDVASIKTTAKKVGGDYVINGSKMWITNGFQADWMCLLANTSQDAPHKNKSLIALPMNTPGVQRARKIEKLGMHCSDTAQIFFEDVRIPQSHVIGDEGMGFTYQMLQFQEERLIGTAVALEPLQRLIQGTIDYTRTRMVFGQPVIDNQYVHFRLAELETEIELVRSTLYRCLGMYLEGRDVTKLASMAKLKIGRLAREVTDTCIQFWGGMGYTQENLPGRFHRDFRLVSIGAGADEVMLSIICKYMGILPTPPGLKKDKKR